MNQKPLTKLQRAVYQAIKDHAKYNPISSHDISEIVRIETRDGKAGANLRSVINILRDKGFAICANQSGYYYANSAEELRDYVSEFQARIDQQQEACDALKNKYELMASLEVSGVDISQPGSGYSQMQMCTTN